MLRKTLLTLSAGMLLGTVVIAPNAALAQLLGPPPMGLGGPPLGGPPPGLGAGGPPLGGPPLAHTFGGPPSGLEGGPLHGGAVAPPRFSRLDGATDIHGLDYGHGGWRHGYWGRYGFHAYGGDSYAQGDGCYYVSTYRRHVYRRVLVCCSN